MRKNLFFLALALSIALPLAACGIKPDSVSAPEGAEEKNFPRTYPDISTDPRPYSGTP